MQYCWRPWRHLKFGVRLCVPISHPYCIEKVIVWYVKKITDCLHLFPSENSATYVAELWGMVLVAFDEANNDVMMRTARRILGENPMSPCWSNDKFGTVGDTASGVPPAVLAICPDVHYNSSGASHRVWLFENIIILLLLIVNIFYLWFSVAQLENDWYSLSI